MSLARSTYLLRAFLAPVIRNVACRTVSTPRTIVLNDFLHGNSRYRRFSSNVDNRKSIDDTKPNVNSEISVSLPNGEHRIMTLQEAQKYARKRNCDLIDIWSEDEQRILYCLMPKSRSGKNEESYITEKHKEKKAPKRMKLFSIMTNISQQDLSVKCNKLIELLKREQSVRISVWSAESVGKTSTRTQAELVAAITKQIEDHGKVQVLNPEVKVGAIKVVIKPINKEEAASS